MKVYKAINAVQTALAKVGIAKDSRNQVQNFNFRGIDAVYNTMAPMLAENGLCILPRMLSRTCEERVNAKGTALFYVTVEAEFDLVSAEDGSKHTIKTFGEAMDSGDKATNKAMSAAYKYACFQAFAIPTEGDNDADSHTHEVVAKASPQKMPESQVIDLLLGIQASASMEDLKTNYGTAYKAAQAFGDASAIKRLSGAKDDRKKELEVAR
jgi:hypothetical protein